MAAFNFHRQRTRRWWYVGATLVVAAFFTVFWVAGAVADNPSGCDFSSANNGVQDCAQPLTGSTFAGGDGNLATSPTAFGTTDWQNVAGLNTGVDLPSGTGDNSFGQGTKTDSSAVSVVSGSIPPNKSDLTRFYEASEVGSNSHNFLYLAFERSNVLGTVNMNFEINQKAQPDLTTTGAKTLIRTAGDLLVTYDFTNGGGRPTIAILRWLTSTTVPVVPGFATNSCFSANTFPCWGDQKILNGTDSIAAVNNLDAVNDPIPPNAPRSQAALTFGETAIDLTTAGVFPSGTCEAFGSTMVTSRSSASFTSEVKDFIAPVPVNISNCGSIKIIKHTDPRGVDQQFSYTSNLPAETAGTVNGIPQGGVTCSGNSSAGVQSDGSFCLNDAGNSTGDSAGNTVYNNALQTGTYTVTEGADPSGFTFESLSCSGGTTSKNGKVATINLAPGDAVTCTYVNQQNSASLSTSPSNTSNPVVPTAPVHDTATIVGNQSSDTPSGNVTFFLCSFAAGSTATCDGTTGHTGTSIGTGTLSGSNGTATADSPNVNCSADGTGCATGQNPLPAGHYCFRATWPGDGNYTSALSFDGSGECFDVAKVNSSTVTTPSTGSIALADIVGGSTVTDTAVVSPNPTDVGQITGTVNFFICGPIATGTCDGTTNLGTAVSGNPKTLGTASPPCPTLGTHAACAVSGGVGSSFITSVGRYCFRAVYSGDAKYNASTDAGVANSECFTVTDTSTVTTTQSWRPQDSAEIKSAGGTPLTGTVTFTLYDNATCTPGTGGVHAIYTTGALNITTNGTGPGNDRTLSTNQSNVTITSANSTGAYSWQVVYSGDGATGSTSSCESTTIAINDNHS